MTAFQTIKQRETLTTEAHRYSFILLSKEFEFSGISFDIREEPEDISDIKSLIFNSVTFKFGDRLIEARDGYSLHS